MLRRKLASNFVTLAGLKPLGKTILANILFAGIENMRLIIGMLNSEGFELVVHRCNVIVFINKRFCLICGGG